MMANAVREFLSRTIWHCPSRRFIHLSIVLITVSFYLQSTFGSIDSLSNFETFAGLNLTCPNFTAVTPCGSVTFCGEKCSKWNNCSGFSVVGGVKSGDNMVCRLCLEEGFYSYGIEQMETRDENGADFWVKRTLILFNPDATHPVPNGFKVGQLVQIRGIPTMSNDTFAFRLRTAKTSDVVASIMGAFDDGQNVRQMIISHKQNRTWSTDAIVPVFPFKVGQRFEVIVLVNPSYYRIYADRQFVYDLGFFHQSSPASIRHLHCIGDADISSVVF